MISRWDPRVNHMVHEGHDSLPFSVVFRCERCGSTEFYPLESFPEHWSDPCEVTRRFALQCARCGMIEATIAQTYLLGGGNRDPSPQD